FVSMEHKHRVGYFRHSFSRPELHIFVACGNSRVLDDHFSIRERFATKKRTLSISRSSTRTGGLWSERKQGRSRLARISTHAVRVAGDRNNARAHLLSTILLRHMDSFGQS